jgi:hypothetical protein
VNSVCKCYRTLSLSGSKALAALRAICNLENLVGLTTPTFGPQRRLVGVLGANPGLFSLGWGRVDGLPCVSAWRAVSSHYA